MASKQDVLDRQKEVTDKISTQVRTIAAGLIVFTWGIYTGTADITVELTKKFAPLLITVDLLCIAAILADFLQYLCAYQVVKDAMGRMRAGNLQDVKYNDTALTFRCQNIFFSAKQVLLAVATALMFCTLLFEIISRLLS